MHQAPYQRLLVKLLEHVRIPQLVRLCPSCDGPMDSRTTRHYTVVNSCRECGLTILNASRRLRAPRLVPVGIAP